MKNFALLLLLAFFATACGDSAAEAEAEVAAAEAAAAAQEKAYETMMEAHDRVMPMMGNITAAQRSIMEEMKTEGLSDDRKDLLTAANEQLEDAGDGMMEWMGNLKTLDQLRADMDNDAIITYIREEAADIAMVETKMAAAIAAGKELVGDLNGHDHGDHGHSHDGHDHKH